MKNKYQTRAQRKQLFFYLEIREQHTRKRLGYLGNISKGGIMILTDKSMQFDDIKAISIQLPEFLEFSKKSIEAEVEKRWTKSDINPDLYCTGCQFLKVNTDELSTIKQLMMVFAFND